MLKKPSNNNMISTLHVGCAVLLAFLLVTSSCAYIKASAFGNVRNSPPNVPSNPFPSNGSTNVSVTPLLNWTGGDPDNDTVTYNVFFGTNQTPPQVATNISTTIFSPGILNLTTTYYWRIIAWDNNSQSATGDLWMFTTRGNLPPYQPSIPFPKNGSINVSLTAQLSWTGGDPDNDTVTYDVFFGTNPIPPQVATNISTSIYDPGTLNFSTTYYWRIIAWDNYDQSTVGPQWSFTTRSNQPPDKPSNPSPADNAVNVPVNPKLTWTGGDPDNDKVCYDVYFGTNPNPPKVDSNITTTTHDPGLLLASTLYYWRIIAWDNHSESTTGDLWTFTTVASLVNVTITKPLPHMLYINDVGHKFIAVTIVYGVLTITANATSPAGIKNVTFSIDGVAVKTFTAEPYSYSWDTTTVNGLRHTITVVAYDNTGKNGSAQITIIKWRLHLLPWLLVGAAVVSVLIPHTTMKGLVLNLHQTGLRGYTFFALRMHFHTVSLLKNVHGVIRMKRVVVRFAISPTVIIKLGPPRTLAYLSIKFLGSSMSTVTHLGGGFLQNLPQLRGKANTNNGRFSSLINSLQNG